MSWNWLGRRRVSVVVQLDRQWPGRAERYRIRRNGSEPIPFKMTDRTPARTSSGDNQVLKQFLMETRESDKAKNYCWSSGDTPSVWIWP